MRRVAAKDLQVGDTCRGSGAIVMTRPVRGLRTPPGKVELTVRYSSGARRAIWGAQTRIAVDRPSDRQPTPNAKVGL